MSPDQKEALIKIGVDIDSTMERFMNNEALFLKCLDKFLSDDCYERMLAAIDGKDVNAAFDASHELKGVSANMGFEHLYEPVKVIVEVFRAGKTDYDPALLDSIKAAYEEIINTVKTVIE